MDVLVGLVPHKGEIRFPYSPPPEGLDIMWRCEAKSYSYVINADYEEYGTTSPVLEMHWYEVKRRTPSGARLVGGKFVYTDKHITSREWASNTPTEALVAFRERRKRQIRILSGQLQRAQYELALTEGAEAQLTKAADA